MIAAWINTNLQKGTSLLTSDEDTFRYHCPDMVFFSTLEVDGDMVGFLRSNGVQFVVYTNIWHDHPSGRYNAISAFADGAPSNLFNQTASFTRGETNRGAVFQFLAE
jgi:hypothetical protein